MLGRNNALTPSPSSFLIHVLNWVDGRKPSSWLLSNTGLSQSYFRAGREVKPKKSTLDRIYKHNLSKIDESVQEVLPSLENQYPSHFQDFVYFYCRNKHSQLYFLAKEIDQLDIALVKAHELESLIDIKNSLLNCELLVSPIYWIQENQPMGKLKADLIKASDIDSALYVTQKISHNIFLSFLAALDLQFCSEAFGTKLKLRPLFLDLLPKANFSMSEKELRLPKKDRFRLPNRRLLELTHAIFYFSKHEHWPEKPVGRKELAAANCSDEASIGNLFDGTKKLTYKTYDAIQQSLDKTVGSNVNVGSFFSLLFAATFWQHSFIEFDFKAKIKSVFLYDKKSYQIFWDAHRVEWASQLSSGYTDWPTWLND